MSLVELNLFHRHGGVQIRAVVYRAGNTGVEDCSRVHHALLPRLELAFPGKDIAVEVSSPGIDRLIKDGSEFVYYLGRGVKCYRTDISGWTRGILRSADEKGVILAEGDTALFLEYGIIARARLDHSVG
jgi:ribosome maturation factor RimP